MYKPEPKLPGYKTGLKDNEAILTRTFWECPRNILPHNIYLASQLETSPSAALATNSFGLMGSLVIALGIGGYNALEFYMGSLAFLWFAWLFIPSLKPYLVAPEFLPFV